MSWGSGESGTTQVGVDGDGYFCSCSVLNLDPG